MKINWEQVIIYMILAGLIVLAVILGQGVLNRLERSFMREAVIESMADVNESQAEYISLLKSCNAELLEALEIKYQREVTITAYTARVEECDADPGNTAFMMRPIPGLTVAVSRDLLEIFPPGQKVYIEGYGVRIVQDVMNSRYKNRIDILMPTVTEALQVAPTIAKVSAILEV